MVFSLHQSSFSRKPFIVLITKRSILHLTILDYSIHLLSSPYSISPSPALLNFVNCIFIMSLYIQNSSDCLPLLARLNELMHTFTQNQASQL